MTIFVSIWTVFGIAQLIYWGIVFQRLAWYQPKDNPDISFPPVSVIICARNEAVNLQNNLEHILKQDYPVFEVVVVNDASIDKTPEVLQYYEEEYPQLSIITIQEKKIAGKKGALTQGIEAAQHEWLLVTDADCQPASVKWIQQMMASRTPSTEMVLGYGPYREEKNWVNRWVQFETFYVALQYLSFALWKKPYMGVGRNLLYKKTLFEENQGFQKHEHLLSGDDDLFVNEVANGDNTTICLHTDAFVFSAAPADWHALYRQKTRHYSSSAHYKWYFKFALGLLSLSHTIYYLGLFFFIGANIWKFGIIILFMIRTFLAWLVLIKCLPKLYPPNLWKYFWLMDLALPIYYAVFASAVFNTGQKRWN